MPKVTELRSSEQRLELKEDGCMGLGTGRTKRVLGLGKLVSGGSLRGVPIPFLKPGVRVGGRAFAASGLGG